MQSLDYLVGAGVTEAVADMGNSTVIVNQQVMKTARAFHSGMISWSKFCYYLPESELSQDNNFLIRLTFPTSELSLRSSSRSSRVLFNVSVDSTIITAIELHPTETRTVELIVPWDYDMYLCLFVEGQQSSMAAISSIEVRPVPPQLYSDGRYDKQVDDINIIQLETYLMTLARVNLGPEISEPPIRFPTDPYDRIWHPYTLPSELVDEFEPRNTTVRDFYIDGLPNLDIPRAVLQTALEAKSENASVSFSVDLSVFPSFDSVYVSEHFYDVHPSGNRSMTRMIKSEMGIETNGFTTSYIEWALDTLVLSNMSRSLWKSRRLSSRSNVTSLSLEWERSQRGSQFLMINAMEMFGEFYYSDNGIQDDQTRAMRNLLFHFQLNNLPDTSGEPCLPIPWTWIECDSVISKIRKIDLRGIGLTGSLPNESFVQLRFTFFLLNSIDFSNNNLSGSVPRSLITLQYFPFGDLILDSNNLSSFNIDSGDNEFYRESKLNLSLRNNSFTRDGFLALFSTEMPNPSLRALYLDHNKLSGPLPQELGTLKDTEEIDLSHNALNGTLIPQLSMLQNLTILNLSYNDFTGSLPVSLTKLKTLGYLDLSGNRLSGQLPLQFLQLGNLTELNLRGNVLQGDVPANIWSTGSRNFSLYLDENRFTKVDLSTWCQRVTRTVTYSAFEQRVSLTRNNITSVVLPSECRSLNLSGTYGDSLRGQNGFILLAENPWCTKLKFGTRTQIERYLCRSDPSVDFWKPDELPSQKSISYKVVIIIVVVGSAFVLIISTVMLIILWRYYRRLKALRQLQQELAKENVRAPFMNYEMLRASTNNFAKENELGRGAFGAVYLAEQADGTKIAVKRLFPTSQNMADFLKEMVLISGIKHKNLVQLQGCCVRDDTRFLIYELVENKNLADALWGDPEAPRRLNWKQRLKICVGIAKGLSYLHEELQPKIIHRDIKPQNILLDNEWNAKIADFGLARPIDTDVTQKTMTIGGTKGYVSPEYATLGVISEKLDVYSYGILVLEIVSGRHCIDLSLPADEFYIRDWAVKLLRAKRLQDAADGTLLASTTTEEIMTVLNMAMSCVQEKPERRPSMSQVVALLSEQPHQLAMDIITELKDRQHLHTLSLTDLSEEQALSDSEVLLGSSHLFREDSFLSYQGSVQSLSAAR